MHLFIDKYLKKFSIWNNSPAGRITMDIMTTKYRCVLIGKVDNVLEFNSMKIIVELCQ